MTREIKGDKVIITHDDGSVEEIKLPKKPSKRSFDAEYDEELVGGHDFEEIEQ